jgi:hypothetical protein
MTKIISNIKTARSYILSEFSVLHQAQQTLGELINLNIHLSLNKHGRFNL